MGLDLLQLFFIIQDLILVWLFKEGSLLYDLLLAALRILDSVCTISLKVQDEGIALIGGQGLAWEVIFHAREELVHRGHVLQVFPNIEQNVGGLFLDLVLGNLGSVRVIILVPLVLVEILDGADVVAKAEGPIVVDDPVEIVLHANAIASSGAL